MAEVGLQNVFCLLSFIADVEVLVGKIMSLSQLTSQEDTPCFDPRITDSSTELHVPERVFRRKHLTKLIVA